MTRQDTNTFALQGIPDVAGPVVISAEQNTARDGKGDGRDTTQDVVVGEGI